jgi:ABC-2 type transport system permease protein
MGKLSFKQTAKKNKNLKYGGYMTIVTAFALVALIVVNLLFEQLKITIDLTPEELYSIGSKTKLILEEVEDDITIYGLYVTGQENTDAVTLIEDYIKNCSKITYKQMDPYANPEFTTPYRQENETIATNSLIVVNETTGKFKIVSNNDLYSYTRDMNYETYEYEYTVTAFAAEEALTSAVQYVVSENTPVLYCLTNHGETELETNVKSLLKKANFDIRSLNLMTETIEPNRYTILVINDPRLDLSELEYNAILEYLDKGGRMIVNLSVNYPDNMTYFDQMLARYGVETVQGTLVETNPSHYIAPYPYVVIPTIGEHKVTEGIDARSVYQLLPIAMTISEDRNRATEITPILTTSDGAVSKADPTSSVLAYEEGDAMGPFYTGLMIEESKGIDGTVYNTVIAVFSSHYMFDSTGYMTEGNYNLLVNTLNHLQDEVDTLYISPKEYTIDNLSMTGTDIITWGGLFVIIIPAALLIAGIVVWSRRKHL